MVGLDPTTQAFRISNESATAFRSNSQAFPKPLSVGGRIKPDHGEKINLRIN
jgi:hypothetical protein